MFNKGETLFLPYNKNNGWHYAFNEFQWNRNLIELWPNFSFNLFKLRVIGL
jgi:hypothetical protein